MKYSVKKFRIIVIATVFCACLLSLFCKGDVAYAEEYTVPSEEEEQTVPDSVDELLDNLDLSGLQSLLDMLDDKGIAVFGYSDIVERIRAVANGNDPDNVGGIILHVFRLFGAEVLEFVPMMLSVLAIVLAYNLISSLRGKFASESIEKVVYFATGMLAVCLVVGYFASVLATAVKFVVSVKTQINAVAPVMITLMTAAGASSSAGVYTPSVALLGAGMTNAITYIVFPFVLIGLVFDVIGSVSSSIKLDKTSDFFRSCCKWFMGTSFFLFVTMLGVSGITATVKDGISIKAARFAVSKYVPIIGGYLSQGFDYIMAGNVLIKNAVGTSAVVLIILTAAPVICRLVVFSLTLKLTAALSEPLGGEKFSGVLSAIGKSASLITTAVIAMTFLYVLFLVMTICTGNIAL